MINNSLKLLTWNAQSIQNKTIDLFDFLEGYKLDVSAKFGSRGKTKFTEKKSRFLQK